MDKVRERGAPLPGNIKENWGNRHTGIWRKREEGGRRKRRERKKRGEEKKEDVEIEELTEEEEGHGDDKLISSKAINGENPWVEIETTEMRKRVKKKTKKKTEKIEKREPWIGNGRKTEKRNDKQQQEKQ